MMLGMVFGRNISWSFPKLGHDTIKLMTLMVMMIALRSRLRGGYPKRLKHKTQHP